MTQKPTTKKQFIAGARCPKCSELDALIFYRQDERPVRECVECGFREVLGEEEREENKKEQPNAAQIITIKEL